METFSEGKEKRLLLFCFFWLLNKMLWSRADCWAVLNVVNFSLFFLLLLTNHYGMLCVQGGQILRNAASLSCLLGQPITVNNIRAGRSNPGLRYHPSGTLLTVKVIVHMLFFSSFLQKVNSLFLILTRI